MKAISLCLFLVACVYVSEVTSDDYVNLSDEEIDSEIADFYGSSKWNILHNRQVSREKRAGPALIAPAVALGARVVKALKDLKKARDAVKAAKEAQKAKDKLLKDTVPSPTKKNQRVHEHKAKDVKDPVKDANEKFDSLKPKDVQTKDGVRVGKVGDQTVKVRENSGKDKAGPPTIEMHKTGAKAKDRITTKVRFDKPTNTPKSSGGSKESGGGWWGGGSKKSETKTKSESKSSGSGGKKSGGGGWWRRRK